MTPQHPRQPKSGPAPAAAPLRILVACASCKRQYDASGLAPKSRFRCRCGELVVVPAVTPHDAAVIRCASCGGPRAKDTSRCGYCHAEFTLAERDRQTLCPSCMTRISDGGRYCHHCATPIVAEESAGSATDVHCPVCGKEHHLTSRGAGDQAPAVLECPRCAGLWLGQEAFRVVLERARTAELPEVAGRAATPADPSAQQRKPGGLYRRCPFCDTLMNRQNYGRRSGVIVDSCKDHGLWFDAQELEGILRWVRAGGERRAEEAKQEAERQAERLARFQRDLDRADPRGRPGDHVAAGSDVTWVEALLEGLFDLGSR